jgi:hypothetical protein
MEELPPFDLCSGQENSSAASDAGSQSSPSKQEFQQLLAGALQLTSEQGARVLAFKHKAPAPPPEHANSMASLYSANLGSAPQRKQHRHIPTTQERILDGEQQEISVATESALSMKRLLCVLHVYCMPCSTVYCLSADHLC